VSLATGLIIAVAPVFVMGDRSLAHSSWSSSRSTSSTRRHLIVRDIVVAAQIAVSLAVLISAGLMVQSLQRLGAIDRGLGDGDVLLASVDPGPAGYDATRIEAFWRAALDRVGRIPGVSSASLAGTVPLGRGRQRQPTVEPASGQEVEIDVNFVGPQYFRTLGIQLLRGREFDDGDTRTSRPVAIVNERLARRFWPDGDPLGREIVTGRKGSPPLEVVGVVRDVRYRELRVDGDPMLYVPVYQASSTTAKTLHVRADGRASTLAEPIRAAIQAIDPNLPLFAVRTVDDQLAMFLAQPRQAAALTGGFGVLALLLSAIGVYGVTALAARRQARELGIRAALGARASQIAWTIGRRAVVVVAAGIAVGLGISLGFTRLAATLLYGVTPTDIATFAVMSALLALVSAAAVYIPARGASRVDATIVMRCE
jgi:predicted permease